MEAALARANVRRALALIRERPGISRAELARALHLTKSSVYDGGRGQTSATGRKPRQLVFARSFGQIVTVDLGGSTLRAAAVDLDGTILAQAREPVDRRHLEDRLTRIVGRMLAHEQVRRPLAVGIGVAGTVDRVQGIVLDAPALARANWDIFGVLRAVSALPVALDNDVNLAALGEQWKGAARGHANVVCLSVGTGIGAGLIIDGHLYRGARGLAGEAGHLYQRPGRPEQIYETFGDLELEAAGYGIARRAQEALAPTASRGVSAGESTSRPQRSANAHSVFLAAEKGDRASVEIVQNAATKIGIAVGNIISLLDPEIVVLLGGIGLGQANRLLPAVRDVVRHITPPGSRGHVTIVGGDLGDDAVLIGAACAAQDMLGLR
jgi:predicted NBD/HSP70 family sugar kinase